MAVGDKVFLADKETLDTVNRNLSDIHSRVGTTTDGGGSASAGTLMGKLNALISSVVSLVQSWTSARAAKIDNIDTNATSAASNAASASAQTAVNNTPSATGTLSQKLSHIISLLATLGQKKLGSKAVNVTISAAGSHTILNVSGAGVFEFASTTMGQANSPLTFEIDGQAQVINTGVGMKYIFGSIYGAGSLLYSIDTSNVSSATPFASSKPVYFSRSLKITVNSTDTVEKHFSGNYALYE